MAEAKSRWSVYEHPQGEFRALPARHLDAAALLLGPIWAFLNGLILLSVGLLIVEAIAAAGIVYWSKWYLVPILLIHGHTGFNAARLLGRTLKENGWVYRGDVDAPTDIAAAARVKSGELEPKLEPLTIDTVPGPFKPVYAIARLTWQAAFRYKFFWAVAFMLVLVVAALPLVLKGDGTAEGLVSVLLTYTLAMVFVLLGATTVWLACGTLSRDVAECQMQMVATKPIPRWQIWLGKWLGIMSLNAALLFLVGISIYGMVYFRVQTFESNHERALALMPADKVEREASLHFPGYRMPRWFFRPWAASLAHGWTVKMEKDAGTIGGSEEDRLQELQKMPKPEQFEAFKVAYENAKSTSEGVSAPDWIMDELRGMLAKFELEKVKHRTLAGRASVKPETSKLEEEMQAYAARLLHEDVSMRLERQFWPEGYYNSDSEPLKFEQVPDFKNKLTQNLNSRVDLIFSGDFQPSAGKDDLPLNGDEWWDHWFSMAKVHWEAVNFSTENLESRQVFFFHLPGAHSMPADEAITLRFKLEGFVNEADESLRETMQITISDTLYDALLIFGNGIAGARDYLTIRTFHEFFVYPTYFGIDRKNDPDRGRLPEELKSDSVDERDIFKLIIVNHGQVVDLDQPDKRIKFSLSIPYWKGQLELLYHESSFEVNFLRSMSVVFCWLGILGLMGLAMASFMDFPMAAFACIGLLVISLCTGVMEQVLADGGLRQTYTIGQRNTHFLDWFALVAFKALTSIISPLQDYSPITSLSEGRSITWGMLGRAYLVVWGLGGGIFAAFGMGVFSQRELALHGKE
ncbi:MAG: hypothetical protein CMO74_06085 [Verrucomicrobiales bacterium]|nr:hypothetical protein [Verrucomicrobiales bacterium]|tara:strand:+ start:16410 stop:18818 length:2409 start_codon:yes stop_codon:yes gene_type:complete